MQEDNQFLKMQSSSFRIKLKSLKKRQQVVGHFKIGQLIGKGGFASVYKAQELHTKSEVAAKIVNLEELSAKDLQHLKREIEIHRHLDHPHIVKIYETIWTETKVYIFMELIRGRELFQYLKENGPMAQPKAAKIFYQITKAVEYLHIKGVAHRDIKTENIIVDSDFNAKLIDFGLARTFASASDDYLTTFCGSPSYTAPQLLEKRRYSGQCIDIWCLGVTLYVLLEAALPFDEFDKKLRERNIQNLNWHAPLYSSIEASQLYGAIFTRERSRMRIQEILQSEFFSKNDISSESLSPCALVKECQSEKILNGICVLLHADEEKLRQQVKYGALGQYYCVYQLLLKKADEQQSQKNSSEQPISKSEGRRSELSTRPKHSTLEPRSEKVISRKRAKSPADNLIRILPVLHEEQRGQTKLAIKYQSKEVLRRIGKDIFEIKCRLQVEDKDKEDVAKQALKYKIGRKYRNLGEHDLGIHAAKPRLREDSPDSPKRLLDCVRRYN